MSTPESPGAIYGCMLDVQKRIGAIAKAQRNQHHGYSFRGIEDVLNALHGVLVESGAFTTPEVVESEVVAFEVQSRNGVKTAFRASVKMAYHFYAVDGSSVVAEAKGGSIDYDDKAEQQAQSQAYKTAMIQTFSIPTEGGDEPDARSPMSEHDARPAARQRPAVSQTQHGRQNGSQTPAQPQLSMFQQQVQDAIYALDDAGRKKLAPWWKSQRLPANERGPDCSQLTDEQANAVLAKVDEIRKVPS
jgi:hypothetical protein